MIGQYSRPFGLNETYEKESCTVLAARASCGQKNYLRTYQRLSSLCGKLGN
jgi:hypothetical protein